MAIIDQQGATIGRGQMGPVAAAAAATATVAASAAAGGQQKKRLPSRTPFEAAILCLMLPQTGLPPCLALPAPHLVAALVGHYGECRLCAVCC